MSVDTATEAFGGLASNIPVTTGAVGSDWWTWTSAPGLPAGDGSVAAAAQRYFVLDRWLIDGNDLRPQLDTSAVIADLAAGPATMDLSDAATLGNGLGGGPFAAFGVGYVSAITANARAATVTVCHLEAPSAVRAGQQGRPTRAELAQALRGGSSLGAWSVRLGNGGDGWQVIDAGKGRALTTSCQGWGNQLRREAGLPPK